MTEVELAQACAEAMYARDQATQGLGIRLLEAGPGQACLRMPVRADMVQGSCRDKAKIRTFVL